jgi:hypothetical protein
MNLVVPRAKRRARARQAWRDRKRLAQTWREHWLKFNLIPLRLLDL